MSSHTVGSSASSVGTSEMVLQRSKLETSVDIVGKCHCQTVCLSTSKWSAEAILIPWLYLSTATKIFVWWGGYMGC